MALQSFPHIQPKHQISANSAIENKRIAQRLVQTLKSNQQPIRLQATQAELNGLSAFGHRAIPQLISDVTLVNDSAFINVSLVLPLPEMIKYLNIEVMINSSKQGLDLDTVYIGNTREITSPFDYFEEERSNVYVVIDSGEYTNESGLWIDGDNIIITGEDGVSLYCSELYENVMWVLGNNIVIDNLHMMHLMPGDPEDQNCSGRVIGFDGADSVTVINCDLNGCGLAGLHDNLGNGVVFVEHNYIHNNSLGAYTDIDGNIWQEEIENHSVFKFSNNLFIDNGYGDQEKGDTYYYDK